MISKHIHTKYAQKVLFTYIKDMVYAFIPWTVSGDPNARLYIVLLCSKLKYLFVQRNTGTHYYLFIYIRYANFIWKYVRYSKFVRKYGYNYHYSGRHNKWKQYAILD